MTGRLAVVIAAAGYEVGAVVLSVARPAVRVEVAIIHADVVRVVAVDAVVLRDVGEAVRQGADRLFSDLLTRSPWNSGLGSHQYSNHHAHYDTSHQRCADNAHYHKDLQTSTTAAVCCNTRSKTYNLSATKTSFFNRPTISGVKFWV